MRVGIGYDVHKLVENRDLILGGVKVPYDKGLLGHSDADVLIHAIIDSILGAINIGDIGQLFPDTDQKFKNISSMILLEKVEEIMSKEGYKIGNIDSVIVCQSPKLKDFIPNMAQNIAKVLKTDIKNVSVKATTEEHLGFTGSGEGIKATCVSLLEKK